ncbi:MULTISPECIES: hypothetical protein [unclassified Streptomyces]|nr:hypothetical protein [Streptomyces sp. AmelKG-E11A]
MLHLVTLGADLRGRGIELHVIEQASTPPRWRGGRCSECCPYWPSRSAG